MPRDAKSVQLTVMSDFDLCSPAEESPRIQDSVVVAATTLTSAETPILRIANTHCRQLLITFGRDIIVSLP